MLSRSQVDARIDPTADVVVAIVGAVICLGALYPLAERKVRTRARAWLGHLGG